MDDINQSLEQTQKIPAKKPWYKKWWVITTGFLIILGIIGSSGENKSDKKSAQEQTQQTSQKSDENKDQKTEKIETEKPFPPIVATSATIAKEYSENEVAADEKYKGKNIEISGKIVSIDNRSFDNEIIVKLSDGQYDFNGPWCYMKNSEKEKVISLKKGQQIVLIGTGDSATLKSPILKNCTIK